MANKHTKVRLDHLLVSRGLVENPSKAKARIMAGDVIVNDHRVDKPGDQFAVGVEIRLRGNSIPYVSRGGLKLEHVLSCWPCDIEGKICLDVGASTGGFTEVLLQHGAKTVYAVDVGYGQIAEKLRVDPRVVNMERTHILHVNKDAFSSPPAVAAIDVSFISLEKILPHVVDLLDVEANIYLLIKPQFEAGRPSVMKGGIVKDPAVHEAVIEKIRRVAENLSLIVLGVDKSPILGAKGNVEYLMGVKKKSTDKIFL